MPTEFELPRKLTNQEVWLLYNSHRIVLDLLHKLQECPLKMTDTLEKREESWEIVRLLINTAEQIGKDGHPKFQTPEQLN